MSPSRLLRFVLLAALSAVPAIVACSSDETPSVDSKELADVVRQGEVTDAQLRAVLANEPQDWAWAGGSFHTPKDGTKVPANPPFEFSWVSDQTVDLPAAGAPSDLQMVHLLVFSTATQPNVLRVFSSLNSYTPDDAAWQTLKAAGAHSAITLSLTSATLQGAELVHDGGPFIGEKLAFAIQ